MIHKDDFTHYLKRFEKKQKEHVIEFFKQIPIFHQLSNQSLVKMEYMFKLHKFEKKGHYVLREGDPVTHIALVKDGEFEVVKDNLRGLDSRILGFLKKSDIQKRI